MKLGGVFLRQGGGSPFDDASTDVDGHAGPSEVPDLTAKIENPGADVEIDPEDDMPEVADTQPDGRESSIVSPETQPISTIIHTEGIELKIFSRPKKNQPANPETPQAEVRDTTEPLNQGFDESAEGRAPRDAEHPTWYNDWLNLLGDGLDLQSLPNDQAPPPHRVDDTTPLSAVRNADTACVTPQRLSTPTDARPAYEYPSQQSFDVSIANREVERRKFILWGMAATSVVALLLVACLGSARVVAGHQADDLTTTLATAHVVAGEIGQVGQPLNVSNLQTDLHQLIGLSEQANAQSPGQAWQLSRWSTRLTQLRLLDSQRADLATLAEAARPLNAALATINPSVGPVGAQDLAALSEAAQAYLRAAQRSQITSAGAFARLASATAGLQSMTASVNASSLRRWAVCPSMTSSCQELTIEDGHVTEHSRATGSAADLTPGEVVLVGATVDQVTSHGNISPTNLLNLLLRSVDADVRSAPTVLLASPVMAPRP